MRRVMLPDVDPMKIWVLPVNILANPWHLVAALDRLAKRKSQLTSHSPR